MAGSKPGLANNSILFCLLFTIKDRCKKVHFQPTHNQGLRQLLTVSGHHYLRTTYANLYCVFVETIHF